MQYAVLLPDVVMGQIKSRELMLEMKLSHNWAGLNQDLGIKSEYYLTTNSYSGRAYFICSAAVHITHRLTAAEWFFQKDVASKH